MSRTARLVAGLAAVLLAGCGEESPPAPKPQPSASASAAPAASGAAPATSASAAGSAAPAVAYEREELPELDLMPESLDEQRHAMVRRMRALEVVTDEQAAAVEKILWSSKRMGQGNPAITEHPMTRAQCQERRRQAGVRDEHKPACGAPFMVPIWDPATAQEQDAKICIDRYEFPGLPCEYPVTWVSTNQAQELCKSLGKRLCDAHEWEGACAGAVLAADKEYAFGQERRSMQGLHNNNRTIVWAYGRDKDHSKCATASRRSKKCTASGWKVCGSNTYPAGSFPECRSSFGVYDQHGNAAEHMALPMRPEQLGSQGGFGVPEMKGSWFIFGSYEAHQDDCRWRCPSWHDNEGKNHSNYHLGFRCCKDVNAR